MSARRAFDSCRRVAVCAALGLLPPRRQLLRVLGGAAAELGRRFIVLTGLFA